MAEETILQMNGVTVTTTRFIVQAQTYAMSGVTSVRSLMTNPSKKGPIILGLIGLLILFGGTKALMVSLPVIALSVVWFIMLKPSYHVVLASASGETRALESKDQDFISKVVHALNEAIVARG